MKYKKVAFVIGVTGYKKVAFVIGVTGYQKVAYMIGVTKYKRGIYKMRVLTNMKGGQVRVEVFYVSERAAEWWLRVECPTVSVLRRSLPEEERLCKSFWSACDKVNYKPIHGCWQIVCCGSFATCL